MKFGIIGAGPSGLAAGLFLKYPYQILEKNSYPGGQASSYVSQGFTFDYGPHIMFSKNKPVLDFMIRSLGKNVHKSKRNNKVYYKGSLIKYPFENDLKSLPFKENFECLKSYLFNPYKKKYRKPVNLKQWLLHHFGQGICEKYLFPYNEKVWNIPVSKLSMSWAERIPNPPMIDIVRSSLGFETEGYLHQLYYHYPSRGGYQAISEAWAKKLKIKYNTKVVAIQKIGKKFIIKTNKGNFEYDEIISTMPIQELIKIINLKIPSRVLSAVNKLIVNPMYTVCLGIKGKDSNKFTAVYFPEKNFYPNRICFPKTFSPHNSPEGTYSIQVDITCKKNSDIWRKKDQEILDHVIDGLVDRGFILHKSKIIFAKVLRSEYAYVVNDTEYEKNVKIIRDWFPKQGIYLLGRFSYFEYINVDMVLVRAMELTEKINQYPVQLANYI